MHIKPLSSDSSSRHKAAGRAAAPPCEDPSLRAPIMLLSVSGQGTLPRLRKAFRTTATSIASWTIRGRGCAACAQRHADIGKRQSWRVVDPIADH
jgi:hypothetical protein